MTKFVIALCVYVCLIAPSKMARADVPLIPQPRQKGGEAAIALSRGISIAKNADAEDRFASDDLIEVLKSRKITVDRQGGGSAHLTLLRSSSPGAAALLKARSLSFAAAMHDEGYFITVSGRSITVVGETAAGVFYGVQTLKQLITGQGAEAVLHAMEIMDWPAMRYRGLDDDLSRGPIVTVEFQKQQIRTLAAYKVNLYSPYFESNLAYSSTPLSAPPQGAMTKEEATELVAYAQRYHVMIVPEQEAFGHLHPVLSWERYSSLAETPHGNVLAPDDRKSLQLIRQWFIEVAAMFPAPLLHIGADETFELGRGRSAQRSGAEGLDAVYIKFLKDVATELAPLRRRLLFWGDIAMKNPELVRTLPKDMIAVAWEYDPHPEGYDRWLQPFRDAGMETWVATGVSNWDRVYPDNDAALQNIQRFVADGQRLGSTGVLNTVWNDDGDALFLENWYGVLFGAAAGWQPGASGIEQFEKSYGQVFHGDESGALNEAQRELRAAHVVLKQAGFAGADNHLFWVDPWSAEGQDIARKLLPVAHPFRLHVERALELILEARRNPDLREKDAVDAIDLGARRMDFLAYQFQEAYEIVTYYRSLYEQRAEPKVQASMRDLFRNIIGTNGRCEDIRSGYMGLKAPFKDLWLRENRPYWIDNMLIKYDWSAERWVERESRFQAAYYQWKSSHTLPSPEQLGLPAAQASN